MSLWKDSPVPGKCVKTLGASLHLRVKICDSITGSMYHVNYLQQTFGSAPLGYEKESQQEGVIGTQHRK